MSCRRWLPLRLVPALALVLFAAGAARADLRREIEPNDIAAEAQPVVPAASIGGVIAGPGDVDLYAVAAEAGQALRADILARGFRAGSQPGSELNAVLEILDPDGVTVLSTDQSAGDFDDPTVPPPPTTFTIPVSGRYLVSVRDISPTEGGPAFRYVVTIELDSNDTAAQATPLLPPVLPAIDTLIHPAGDRDVYSLQGFAGDVLTTDIDSAVFNPANPPAKIVLTILDAALAVLAQDAYTSTDPEDPFLQVVLPADGTYYIDVRELRSFVGTTNTFYQLGVEVSPAAGNDSYASATRVTLPRPVSGTVSPSTDVDHYRFTLGSAATVSSDLDAREDLISLLDGSLELHDSSGLLASNSSLPDPALSVAVSAGDYSVAVEGPCDGPGCENEDSYYVLFLDADADADGLVLPADNCPLVANPGQADTDADGAGDACDNCPSLFNPDQADDDADGIGDLCQACLPTETITDLTFLSSEDLAWAAAEETATYNLYRGTFGMGSWQYDHACLAIGLISPVATDAEDPGAGGFYYLVSATNPCGEGPLGVTSAGLPRPNPLPCP